MKKIICAIAVAAIVCGAGAASAQKTDTVSARTATAQAFANYCASRPEARGVVNIQLHCACASGVLEGHMTERQYGIVGRLVPFMGNQPGMQAEVRTMVGEGYNAQEVIDVGNMMTSLAPEVGDTCDSLQ